MCKLGYLLLVAPPSEDVFCIFSTNQFIWMRNQYINQHFRCPNLSRNFYISLENWNFTELSESVIRPRFNLATVDKSLSRLTESIFSKLDANSGFFHADLLSERLQLMTSFVTPWSGFCYRKFPFGITSGPEYFRDKMHGLLEYLENTSCLMDDMCICSDSAEIHENYLLLLLRKLQDPDVTLYPEKCEFMKPSITCVGHKIIGEGISVDDNKVQQ